MLASHFSPALDQGEEKLYAMWSKYPEPSNSPLKITGKYRRKNLHNAIKVSCPKDSTSPTDRHEQGYISCQP